jgi:hypothetical protein
MSTDEFYNIFNVLYTLQNKNSEKLSKERNKTIRLLDALGHCEFDYNHRKVYVCPPQLIGVPSINLPKALLTGARSIAFIQELKKVVNNSGGNARILLHQQENPLIPSALIVEASDQQTIKNIANKMNILFNPKIIAWELINFVACIDKLALKFKEKKPPNWDSKTFSVNQLKFTKQEVTLDDGVNLVEYTNPITQQYEHWLWRKTLAAEVDRDWGRYIVLAEHGKNIIVHDKTFNKIFIPEQVPLPRLLARALTLSSGMAPKSVTFKSTENFGLGLGIRVLAYSMVPPEIVCLLTKKLSQLPIIREKQETESKIYD